MKQQAKSGLVLLAASALLLAGCTAGETTVEPGETTAPGGENSEVSAPINYSEKWETSEPAELLFPHGDYTFTYSEDLKIEGSQTWSAEGKISFYEDGTCAFDVSGVKTTYEGKTISYRLVKEVDSYPLLQTSEYTETPVWINDPLLIESSYRTNYPAMGAFPRYKDFASFCALQKLGDLGQRGGAEVGYFFWESAQGEVFASESKEWYYDFMLTELEIEPKDYKEAREIIDLMYYGSNNIFTYDGQGRVEVKENGEVVISTGFEDPDNSMTAQMSLVPTEETLVIDLSDAKANESLLYLEETLDIYVSSYESGIEYLRDVKRAYDEYAAENPESE